MRKRSTVISRFSLGAALSLCAAASWSMVSAEDMKLIEAAGCDEIIREYRNFSLAEKQVAEEIRQTSNSTTATNVIGVATMAALGIGFFSWNDQVDARTNLAELTAYREAIAAEGKKKNCALPAS